MGFAIRVYEAFKDDEVKAKVLTEFIEMVEQAIMNNQLATRQDVTLSELKLTKEIEQVRAELRETELKLTKEIEEVRAELKIEINQTKVSLLKWLIGLLITQTVTIIGVIIGLFQVLK